MKLTKKLTLNILFEILMYAVAISAIAIFYNNNSTVTILLLIILLIRIKLKPKKDDLIYFSVSFLAGTIGEIILVYFGVWQYLNPTLLGIPLWLPIAWGLTIVMMRRIGEHIKNLI